MNTGFFNKSWKNQVARDLEEGKTTPEKLNKLKLSLEKKIEEVEDKLMTLFDDDVEMKMFKVLLKHEKKFNFRLKNAEKIAEIKKYDNLKETVAFLEDLISKKK